MLTKDTRKMTHDDWLQERRKAIGGSDAAAIVGLNPYASAFTVWLDKLGKSAPKEENEAMRLGHDLEEYVARRFTEASGKKVRRVNAILYNAQYPFAHANVDRMVCGENAILECKTTSVLNLHKFRNGEYPTQYYVQCMHYMAVTGAKKAYLAVLVLGQGFYWFEIPRDQEEINALMDAEERFWHYVVQQKEPPVSGMDCDTAALFDLYPQSNGQAVELFGRAELLKQYLALKKEIKEKGIEAERIANTIKQDMQEAERGQDGAYTVTWRTQTRSTFDAKAFSKENPQIDLAPYYKTSTCRVFAVKE